MKLSISHLAILVFISTFSIGAYGQNPVNKYDELLAKALTAPEINKVLKTAEKERFSQRDILDLRYSAYFHTVERTKDRSLKPQQRNELAALSLAIELKLPGQLEKYLSDLERTTPDSREISQTSVRLALLLSQLPFLESSDSRRAKLAKQRAEKIQDLYRKALQVEQRLDRGSLESLTLTVLLADEYLAWGDIEEALPLYEEAVEGIAKLAGLRSQSLIRPMVGLAQIADIAGDIERFETLKKQLSELGIVYERTVLLNVRATGDTKGIKGRSGRVQLEKTYWLGALTGSPDQASRRSNNSRIPSVEMFARVKPELKVVKTDISSAHPAIVTVDTEGNVIDVEVLLPTSPKDKVAELVRKWKFRPLVYNGNRSQMKGLVYCWILDRSFP